MKTNKYKFKWYLLNKLFSDWGFTWNGFIDNRNGEWFLIIQILIIILHLIPPWPIYEEWPFILFVLGDIFIAYSIINIIYSLLSLGRNLSPLPEPKKSSVLITKQAYQYCRHPLYKNMIILSAGLTIATGSIFHFLLLNFLSYILIIKAKREEKGLVEKYMGYKDYMTVTPSIFNGIPFFDWRE